ncbi:hypothetical protein FGADI_325 [Fusarium gaditjirri]|uniref:Transmembrane protein n=1 Tax=Fusarium gaditjirri TaxID=282569 RepID=A0A8H4X472_9HYPO|nr:hypothetical protein FGADI_325 [Fusarium gaditjirri]
MDGFKVCWKGYDNDGVLNRFFLEKGVPCTNLLNKLKGLETSTVVSEEFLLGLSFILLNYFMVRRQLKSKSNDDAKNQGSCDSTTKFKPLACIQRSERNRARAIVFSSWMFYVQLHYANAACILVLLLAYRSYLADFEWAKPYALNSVIAAIRFLLLTFIAFGGLSPFYHVLKAQAQYIRALIQLELPPERETKDESCAPQELPASAPPSSIQATNTQTAAPRSPVPPMDPVVSRIALEKLARAAALRQAYPYLDTTRESPYEHEKRAMKIAPERRTQTPAFLLLPPRSDVTYPMTTAQQPTSEAGQQGSQTTVPHLSRNPSAGNAPPSSYTDSTTNVSNNVSRQEALVVLVRRLNEHIASRQRTFNTRAYSPTERVPVGEAFEENAAKSSDSPAESEDWEHVHHEEEKSSS